MLLKYFMLILLLTAFAYGTCQEDIASVDSEQVFTEHLKNNIFAYLANPARASVSSLELDATITFYFHEPNIDSNSICNAQYEGIEIGSVVKKFVEKPVYNLIPRCSDGTQYGKCSKKQPYFCYSGKLVPMCAGLDRKANHPADNCGCPNADDTCYEDTGYCNVECMHDSDCGYLTMDYQCSGTKLKTFKTEPKCDNYQCTNTGAVQLPTVDCADTGEYCVSGISHCVECTQNFDCTASEPSFYCNDNAAMEKICTATCNNAYSCDQDCTTSLSHNCTQYGQYCVEEMYYAMCKECLEDSHCESQNEISYTCSSQQQISWTGTRSTCSDGYCTNQAVNGVFTDCLPGEECQNDCELCYNLLTPEHNLLVWDASQGPGMHASVANDFFIQIELYRKDQYSQLDRDYQYLEPVLVSEQGNMAPVVFSCDVGSLCKAKWNMASIPDGEHTYSIKVINQSGASWTLPRDKYAMEPFYCAKEFTIYVGGTG